MSRTMPLARWFLSVSAVGGTLFLCAGRIHAPMLAAYLAVFAGMGLVSAILTNDSLDGERRKPGPEELHPNSRKGTSTLFLLTVAVAALDAGRFHWTTLGGQIKVVALAAMILAAGLQVWAMTANPYFSTAIRIQNDRGHELVTRGPYRLIRHPGYLAMIIIMPATALVFGSLAAIIPGLGYAGLILWRTKMEEEFLTDWLAGYTEYAARVRYRLIPGLW